MSLQNWFKGKTRSSDTSPRLETLVEKVTEYIRKQPHLASDTEFRPPMVSVAIGESELAVLAAFSVLEDAGIARHHYGLYCSSTNSPIEVYDSREEIPARAPCELCDRTHSLDKRSMWVEVFFTVDVSRLPSRRVIAA